MTVRDGVAVEAPPVVVWDSFDNLQAADVRLTQEASKTGPVHVRLWSDRLYESLTGRGPDFPQAERRFLVSSLRYVRSVGIADDAAAIDADVRGVAPALVASRDGAAQQGGGGSRVGHRVFDAGELAGFPDEDPAPPGGGPRVVVTGCYDWLHSGHVEFFREAASLGELYVVVGSDRNVRLLKGDGHPLRSEAERRYMVGAIRFVHRALVSSGHGWMDAEPEIAQIRPEMYVVNEDGDQPEKRDFCRAHGIEYVVLRRRPHKGLPARSSTVLRGF